MAMGEKSPEHHTVEVVKGSLSPYFLGTDPKRIVCRHVVTKQMAKASIRIRLRFFWRSTGHRAPDDLQLFSELANSARDVGGMIYGSVSVKQVACVPKLIQKVLHTGLHIYIYIYIYMDIYCNILIFMTIY